MVDRFTRNISQSFLQNVQQPVRVLEPLADMVEGFTLVGAQTTIGQADLQPLAIQWASGVYEGRKNITGQIAKALCRIDWSWDAFDSMVQRLLNDDLWPMPWHHYKKKIKAGEGLDDVRAKIFIQTARTASGSIKLSKNKSYNTMLRLDGWHLYTDSEVGAHYVRMFADQVHPRDWRTWPPLYPGDLSTIKHGLDGVHSRFGKFLGLSGERPFWADPFN